MILGRWKKYKVDVIIELQEKKTKTKRR